MGKAFKKKEHARCGATEGKSTSNRIPRRGQLRARAQGCFPEQSDQEKRERKKRKKKIPCLAAPFSRLVIRKNLGDEGRPKAPSNGSAWRPESVPQ